MKFKDLYESLISITEAERKTVAIVPGSFKPPHAGHWDMITKYSKMADKVVVVISQPSSKSTRSTKSGKVITPEMAKEIFEIYKKKYGLKNVEIELSKSPSPVGAAYDMIKELEGSDVILGASTKDDDWKRWKYAAKYVEKNDLDVNVKDLEATAVKPLKSGSVNISASIIRDNIDDLETIKPMLPKKLSDSDIESIMTILK
jgi:cytidyltransferase-like protein